MSALYPVKAPLHHSKAAAGLLAEPTYRKVRNGVLVERHSPPRQAAPTGSYTLWGGTPEDMISQWKEKLLGNFSHPWLNIDPDPSPHGCWP